MTFVGFHAPETLPIKAGDVVTIKKGVIVKTVGREPKPAGRTYKIKVHHVGCGMVAHNGNPAWNPTVVWPGPGGYWSEVDINDVPEVAK